MIHTDDTDALSGVRFAGFWMRVGASFIDGIILLPLAVISNFAGSIGLYIGLTLLNVIYKPVLERLLGGTLGKKLIGLRIVDCDGRKISWVSAVNRSVFIYLMFVPNIFIGVKQRLAGIRFDFSNLEAYAEAITAFNQNNSLLLSASYVTSILWFVACLWLLFNPKKRALHDLISESYVVYAESLKR